MAHQLRRRGEVAVFLAGLNAPVPQYQTDRISKLKQVVPLGQQTHGVWEQARGLGRAEKIAFLARKAIRSLAVRGLYTAKRATNKVAMRSRAVFCRGCVALNMPIPGSLRERFFVETHNEAERIYRVVPYPGAWSSSTPGASTPTRTWDGAALPRPWRCTRSPGPRAITET